MSIHGYAPVPYAYGSGPSRFFGQSTCADFRCFVYFRYLPKHKGYDVTLGVQSSRVRAALGAILAAVYADAELTKQFVDERERPCLSMFNADALMNWQFGEMSAREPASLERAIDGLFERAVLPMFEAVRSCDALLDLLLKTHSPFEWWRSSPSPRLAQITILAFLTRRRWDDVRSLVRDGERLLSQDYLIRGRASRFLDDLYAYCPAHFASESSSRI
jgi:hypothetical protein